MKALKGIKIIDFTRLLPGPLATHLLAQMGAEVIKIESPKRMDYARASGMQVDGASVLFHQLNHNKTMKLIDYNEDAGKKEMLELIKEADALIEQFRPGAMKSWGFGYEEIKKINPNIVYVSLTGYGQENDYSTEAGHDLNYLAYAGVMSLMKDENGKPTVSDTQFSDISGSYMAVMAIQTALLKKERTGKGSFVDVSIADAINPFLAVPYALHKGGLDYRQFNIINGKTTANYAVYQCADEKWISIGALELKFWNNLSDIVGKPEWKRENPMAVMNIQFPKQEVETLFKTKTLDEWMSILQGQDVCAAPILEIEELENSHYHQNKGTFEEFETKEGTKMKTIALPFKIK
jgi:crotonobetainyl-CoA:carnitine CoA-transferase CaiB-like acyl-CoA transferase